MKKAVFFVVLAMVVVGFCSAQSADAQKLVGTWISQDGKITLVFNANGTGTSSGWSDPRDNGNIFWGVSVSGKIRIVISFTDGSTSTLINSEYFISPDGKRIYLEGWFLKK